MTHASILVLAMILDAALGEPKWLWQRFPHPAVLMGRAVGWIDHNFNNGNRKLNGILGMAVLVILAAYLGHFLSRLPGGPIIETLLAAILIAQRSLSDHVRAVANGLRISLSQGKTEVAKIVGRDTAEMDEAAVARAAIESAAENLSDGVVAPVFWFLLFGLPGILVYKITNTADSMIGYKTPRHLDFGWAAARLDDVLNWVPARLTAGLIALSHLRPDVWSIIIRDAGLHRSPNAGWPEAAMAATLGVSLSGPRSYEGQMQDFPYVFPEGRKSPLAKDIDSAANALWRSWILLIICVGLLMVV